MSQRREHFFLGMGWRMQETLPCINKRWKVIQIWRECPSWQAGRFERQGRGRKGSRWPGWVDPVVSEISTASLGEDRSSTRIGSLRLRMSVCKCARVCVCVCAAREQMRDGESSMYVRAGQKEKTSSIWLLFALIIDVNLARPLPVEALAPTDLNKPNRQDETSHGRISASSIKVHRYRRQ